MNIFKAYDIRGKYPEELTKDIAKNIGYDIAETFNCKKILICRDIRHGSEPIRNALIEGFKFFDKYIEIVDAGITSTPMFYYILQKNDFDFGIMITASHDPKDYCGMKLWKKDKEIHPVSYGYGEELIALINKRNRIFVPDKGIVITHKNYITEYHDYLIDLSKIKDYLNFGTIKVVVDYSNGSASLNSNFLGETAELIEINKEMNADFPGHEPNPLLEESQVQCREAILKNKADFGIIFDGDGDRIVFLNEKGERVQTEKIVALDVAEMLTENKEIKSVVETLNMSEDLAKELARRNIRLFKTRIGYVFVREKAMAEDSAITAEKSTHFSYRETGFTDSAILTYLYILKKLINARKEDGLIKFSELEKETHISREAVENVVKYGGDREELLKKLYAHYKDKANKVDQVDEYTFHFDNYWFNVRRSNTMPEIKITIEAASLDEEKKILSEIMGVLNLT
jgi:phosphomannomutase